MKDNIKRKTYWNTLFIIGYISFMSPWKSDSEYVNDILLTKPEKFLFYDSCSEEEEHEKNI